MNKNIIFVTNLHLWSLENGKGGRAFYNTIDGYIKDGWNIWLITTGGGVPKDILHKINLIEESYPKLDILYTGKNRVLSIISRYLKLLFINVFYLKNLNKIIKKFNNEKFVIYSYEVHGVYSAKKISKKYNLPLVTRFQGTIHSNTKDTFLNKIKKFPHLSAYATSADLTIMTNDGTKGLDVLRRFGNFSNEIKFWRNGVTKVSPDLLDSRQKFRNEFDFRNEFVFLTVSRLVSWKRVERSIYGIYELLKYNSGCRLVIVGDGVELLKLKNLVNSLEIQNNVFFMGALPQASIYKIMIASDVFLSLYDLSNVGNPLMEAMMCSKPIITLNVGDTNQLISNNYNGILLEYSDLPNLHEFMYKLISDPEYKELISRNAYETALKEFWSWEERINSELKIVGKLL